MNTRFVSTQPNNAVWVFIHLPKTGGTTVNGHFRQHLRWDETFIHLAEWGNRYRKATNRKPLEERPLEERSRIEVLSGHHAYYGIHRWVPNKVGRYFTIVRDPAQRCVSRYNALRSLRKISD